jgi:hypothetical protein
LLDVCQDALAPESSRRGSATTSPTSATRSRPWSRGPASPSSAAWSATA